MTCNTPLNQRVKALCAFAAAIFGSCLIVFAGMALHYNSELKENEIRYDELQKRLADEHALGNQAVKSIIKRLDALESGVEELKSKGS